MCLKEAHDIGLCIQQDMVASLVNIKAIIKDQEAGGGTFAVS